MAPLEPNSDKGHLLHFLQIVSFRIATYRGLKDRRRLRLKYQAKADLSGFVQATACIAENESAENFACGHCVL